MTRAAGMTITLIGGPTALISVGRLGAFHRDAGSARARVQALGIADRLKLLEKGLPTEFVVSRRTFGRAA